MSQTPIIPIFGGVTDMPIVKSSDALEGLVRMGYEKVRGRSTQRALSANVSQVVSSSVGRMVEDRSNPIIGPMPVKYGSLTKAVSAGLVSGGIDWAMGKKPSVESFVAPAVIDYAYGWVPLNSDPRIL